ncbi:MAG: cyclic nucleotide-binding domain-containing protein [Acidobacteriota bacterium]
MPKTNPPAAATRELRPLILFDKLDVDEIRLIASLTTTVEHPKGHRLFAQGDPGDCLYVVVAGRVRIEVARGTRTDPVATLEEGAVIGEIGLLVKDRRSASAHAETDVRLLMLPREKLLAEVQKGTLAAYKVIFNIARDLARKLRGMNQETPQKPELSKLEKMLQEWSL